MKKALFKPAFTLFIMVAILPLIFFANKPSGKGRVFNRYWLPDKLSLLYSKRVPEKIAENRAYTLSFRIGEKMVVDTLKFGHLLAITARAEDSLRIVSHTYSDKKLVEAGISRNNCCLYKGRLFVLSPMQADNEKATAFLNNTVVDVYQVSNGKYEGSFYIPDTGDKKARAISILSGVLVVLYPQDLSIYNLPGIKKAGIGEIAKK